MKITYRELESIENLLNESNGQLSCNNKWNNVIHEEKDK